MTAPLSDLARKTTKVSELVARQDLILSRGEGADLYLSTRQRHEQAAQAQRITTTALTALARLNPPLAGQVLTDCLPWVRWLEGPVKAECVQELRAGAQTGQLRPFFLALEAWKEGHRDHPQRPGGLHRADRPHTSTEALDLAHPDQMQPGKGEDPAMTRA